MKDVSIQLYIQNEEDVKRLIENLSSDEYAM